MSARMPAPVDERRHTAAPDVVGPPRNEELPTPSFPVPSGILRGLLRDKGTALMQGDARQHALFVRATIHSERLPALSALLAEINADVEENPIVPFARLTTLHFGRFVIVEADRTHGPPALLFATDYDGDVETHLEELADIMGEGLHEVFGHCQEYPSEDFDRNRLISFLRSMQLPTHTFYVGTTGRSVAQIKAEARLRDAIEDFLDTRQDEFAHLEPLAVRNGVVGFVKGRKDLAWALRPPVPPPRSWPPVFLVAALLAPPVGCVALLCLGLAFAGAPMLAIAVPVALVLMLAGAVVTLRVKESSDKPEQVPAYGTHVKVLREREDHIVQNQMSSILEVKPGPFRRTVLRLVLWFINAAARRTFNQGTLGGIPSIHFARWVLLDGDRRLVFFSNFDGSWENYLGDFIDKASNGLTAVWSNCVGFPRTRFLVLEGARNEQRFKAYSRNAQIPTQVWYSAYKDLSVENINANSRLRAGLSGDMTPATAQAWLRLM